MLRRTLPVAYALLRTPPIANEPMKTFEPGSADTQALLQACAAQRQTIVDCPIRIAGKAYRTAEVWTRTMPSDHAVTLATSYYADAELARAAVEAAVAASASWSQTPFRERAAVFLKAAHLLSTKYANAMRAATMLGQSKNAWQAEIDCVAEACDFLRWNVHFAEQLYATQPASVTGAGVWNMTDYRPLEGFCSAITPFNFTAIAANLAGAPALMGNTVVWKPSPSAVLSNYLMYTIFEEAGLPPGVLNFVPCTPEIMERVVNADARLAAVAFTGSTRVFQHISKSIYSHLETYRNFPRVTGETGGKDFHLLHPSADLHVAAAATLRAAFEYQGQKCSACSRAYVPASVWPAFRDLLLRGQAQLRMGQPDDMRSFMCAVIDAAAYAKIKGYIDTAKREHDTYTLLAGGDCDATKGYFIAPTIVQTRDPHAPLMREEVFGPLLTIYVYEDSSSSSSSSASGGDYWDEVCQLVNRTADYGLTGAVFARERAAIQSAERALRYTCGNFYVNDKCTGAVVGQQPFGGARASGSNDKPGSGLFLTRFVSARCVKENFDARPALSYPHQLPDVYTLD